MDIANSWYSDDLFGYYTIPNDVLVLVEKISDPRFTSEELSSEMLNAMTETHLEDRIPEKLPLEVRVAHKTGTYEDNISDAGVVFYEDQRGVVKRYYMVVLAKGAGEDEARDAVQSISQPSTRH
jgi:beta-lactamase class A